MHDGNHTHRPSIVNRPYVLSLGIQYKIKNSYSNLKISSMKWEMLIEFVVRGQKFMIIIKLNVLKSIHFSLYSFQRKKNDSKKMPEDAAMSS